MSETINNDPKTNKRSAWEIFQAIREAEKKQRQCAPLSPKDQFVEYVKEQALSMTKYNQEFGFTHYAMNLLTMENFTVVDAVNEALGELNKQDEDKNIRFALTGHRKPRECKCPEKGYDQNSDAVCRSACGCFYLHQQMKTWEVSFNTVFHGDQVKAKIIDEPPSEVIIVSFNTEKNAKDFVGILDAQNDHPGLFKFKNVEMDHVWVNVVEIELDEEEEEKDKKEENKEDI